MDHTEESPEQLRAHRELAELNNWKSHEITKELFDYLSKEVVEVFGNLISPPKGLEGFVIREQLFGELRGLAEPMATIQQKELRLREIISAEKISAPVDVNRTSFLQELLLNELNPNV